MLPEEPWLVKCPHCHALIWIDEQKKLFEWPVELFGAQPIFMDPLVREMQMLCMDGFRFMASQEKDEEKLDEEKWLNAILRVAKKLRDRKRHEKIWQEAGTIDHPSREDYFGLLGAMQENPEKEIYIRIRAWWSANDARREDESEIPLTQEEQSNLKALVQLLGDRKQDNRIMKAEALRELGEFDKAKTFLEGKYKKDLQYAAEFITELVRRGDTRVREVKYV
jgi:hypothetical protein